MSSKVKGFWFGSIVTTVIGFMITAMFGWVGLQASTVPWLKDSLESAQKSTSKYRKDISKKLDVIISLQTDQNLEISEALLRVNRCEEDIKSLNSRSRK